MKSLHFLFMACFLYLNSSLFAQDFDIYVSSGGNHSVIKYDQNGENPTVFIAPSGGGLGWPQDILFLEEENAVLVSSFNTRDIKKYNAETGEFIENFINLTVAPTRMVIRDSLLYVLPWAGPGIENPIVRYQLDGTFVDEFTNAGVAQAIGMAWDAAGNFYVSSYGSRYIRKFDPSGQDLGFFITTNLAGPTNIWFDANGDLLVVDYNAGNVKRFNAEGNYLGVFIGGMSQPEGVAFLPDGHIMIGNGGTNKVKMYNSEGIFIEDLPTTGVALSTPNAVVLRNKRPSSIGEIFGIDTTLISPSIGTYFSFLPNTLLSIKNIEIYDMKGTLIEKKIWKEDLFLDAKDWADGVYVIVAKAQNGKIYSQKLVVQR